MLFVYSEERLVQYARWAPHYERIRSQFGFDWLREREAADRLRERLPGAALVRPEERISRRIAGRDAVVVGLAPHAGAPPVWRLSFSTPGPVLVAADGATARCLDAGLTPDVIVTDLDGPVPSLVSANAKGSLVVIHAHGDNPAVVDRWVPEFSGELAGSWAGPPGDGLIDVGGFTDGDRAAFLAHHYGARRVLLWGFDFEDVDLEPSDQRDRKRAKLLVARDLLGVLAREGPPPLLVWAPDGRLTPYEEAVTGPSTQ